MKRSNLILSAVVVFIGLCNLAGAADKKSPQGHGEDDAVSVTASLVSPEQLRDAVGSDFGNQYSVVEVHLSPKGNKPYQVHLDDFILRSEQSGEHTGPMTSPNQIAGSTTLKVERTYGNKENADSPKPLTGTKLELKTDDKTDPSLVPLKQKMLAEKVATEAVSGWLFFPLQEKAKHLILSYKTPASHIRISFK